MAKINGKWKFVSGEGGMAFSKSIGISDDFLAKNQEYGNPNAPVIEEFTITADKVNAKIIIAGKQFSDNTLPLNKEVTAPGLDGRPGTHLITLVGDHTIDRIQKVDGKEAKYHRVVTGNDMTVTMTGPGGVTAVRKYVRM